VSELRRDGHTIRQIAGYDTRQMFYIICRKRDKHGRLIRSALERLPPWVEVDDDGMRTVNNPVGFGDMFSQVQRKVRKKTATEATAAWQAYLADNPGLRQQGGVEYASR
jgi:hypothetical protein